MLGGRPEKEKASNTSTLDQDSEPSPKLAQIHLGMEIPNLENTAPGIDHAQVILSANLFHMEGVVTILSCISFSS